MLYPDARITFQHLEGRLHFTSEEFWLSEVSEGTQITYLGISLAVVPLLTLITLAPVALLVMAVQYVVLGVAFGFIMLNTLVLVIGLA